MGASSNKHRVISKIESRIFCILKTFTEKLYLDIVEMYEIPND